MSSIFGYLRVLSYFLTLYMITTDTQSINEKDNVEPILNKLPKNQNQLSAITLANYRHRFEHSTKLKKVRWTLKSRYNIAYCDFCDLAVPVVNFLSRILLIRKL